tara:strand:+ start:2195 stop:2593 length:399 start_codon:yes stop_codon:yes gene_type:complete
MLIWDLILLYYAALAIERVKEGEEMPKDSPPRDVLQIAARDPLNFALANCLRPLSIDAVEAAQSSHPGAPMAMAERALAGEFGWTRYVVSEEDVIGLDCFGVFGRAEALYRAFGINREAIIEKARALLGSRG